MVRCGTPTTRSLWEVNKPKDMKALLKLEGTLQMLLYQLLLPLLLRVLSDTTQFSCKVTLNSCPPIFSEGGPCSPGGLGWESGVRSNRVWIHFLAPLDMIHWTLGWDSISVRFETARIYLIRSWLTSYSWTFLPGTMPDTMQGMLWCQSIEMKHFCEQKRASSMCQRQAVEWNTKATWVFWRPVC